MVFQYIYGYGYGMTMFSVFHRSTALRKKQDIFRETCSAAPDLTNRALCGMLPVTD